MFNYVLYSQIKDSLYDSQVFDSIKTVVNKVKKSLKSNKEAKESKDKENNESEMPETQTIEVSMSSMGLKSNETKTCIDEIEEIMESIRLDSIGEGNFITMNENSHSNMNGNVSNITETKAKRTKKATVTKKSTKKVVSDDEEEVEVDEVSMKSSVKSSTTKRTTTRVRKPMKDISNIDEEEVF